MDGPHFRSSTATLDDWTPVLPVIERDDVVVIGGDDDGSMRTAPLGVLSGAVVVSVTGSSPR